MAVRVPIRLSFYKEFLLHAGRNFSTSSLMNCENLGSDEQNITIKQLRQGFVKDGIDVVPRWIDCPSSYWYEFHGQ
jgi:hypothetical protein